MSASLCKRIRNKNELRDSWSIREESRERVLGFITDHRNSSGCANFATTFVWVSRRAEINI
jgi:hypothetical protein